MFTLQRPAGSRGAERPNGCGAPHHGYHAPQRSRIIHAAGVGGGSSVSISPAAQQLLDQLASTARSATTSSDLTLEQLQPHFGSKLASQLVQRAGDAVKQATPSVQLPEVPQLPSNFPAQLPSVQLPQLPSAPQLPAVQLPEASGLLQGVNDSITSSSAAAAGAADAFAHMPERVQQQLQLLLLQLQELGSANSALEPHFGSRALLSWLHSAAVALTDILHVPAAVLTSPGTPAQQFLSSSSDAYAVLSSFSGNIASNASSSMLDSVSGFAGAAATSANLDAALASLQVLSANAATSLPAGMSSSLIQSMDGLQQQVSAASSSLQQLQLLLAQLGQHLQQLPEQGMGGYDFPTLCFVAAGALAAVAASVPSADAASGGTDNISDALSHEYDPAAAEAYFKRRPVLVAQRSLQLSAELSQFGLGLLMDLGTNKLQANEAARAVQLRGIIERLGPAYVKVAQALSTRVDLLPPEYFKQVQLLQDRVPPFPCEQAKEAMTAAFGRPADQVFSYISPRPVAAASLGQVYQARLRPEYGGLEVAVKVQRPGVLEQVCLDLYLMRQAAAAISAVPEVTTDWPALIDSWALRFLHEMDYTREAANGQMFRQQMADAGVTGVVTADVITDLSNDVVLTTAWVNGEKLSESRAADVRELCNTLLSAYLIQLLDTGLLHADPHPGNLIRTVDGKICVLDFGLMTEVTPTQRIALFEYIAHLTTQDWEKVAYDLQNLGFIPEDVGDDMLQEMSAPLGRILSQLSGGGGATKLNIDAVMSELEGLGKSYPFSIPPFFALILRAFSVIEGIALTVDPDYSIVQECFPYMARRLLADDDPRVKQALRDVLYGGKTRLDVDRLIRLSDAFSAYTTDGLAAAPAAAPAAAAAGSRGITPAAVATASPTLAATSSSSQALIPAAKDALLAVFSKRGSYVQELLVEELVAAADALSREALSETLRLVLGSAPVAVALSSLEAAGPFRPLLLPFTGPLELLSRLAPAVALTPEDEEALGVVRSIFQLVQRMQNGAVGAEAAESSSYSPPGVADAGNAASGMVFSTTGGGPRLTLGSVMMQPAALDGRDAVAAAVEAVSDAANVAQELQPLLPELLPGLTHTGELFVRAFVQRVAQRASESLSLAGFMSRQQEEDLAMAALSMMPRAARFGSTASQSPASSYYTGSWASSGNQPGSSQSFSSSTWPQQQQPRTTSSSPSMAAAAGRFLGSTAGRAFKSGFSRGPITPGELVTGLVAAPLLAVLTPLAILSEMQRQSQQQWQQQQQEGQNGKRW